MNQQQINIIKAFLEDDELLTENGVERLVISNRVIGTLRILSVVGRFAILEGPDASCVTMDLGDVPVESVKKVMRMF